MRSDLDSHPLRTVAIPSGTRQEVLDPPARPAPLGLGAGIDVRQALGIALVVLGIIIVAVGWYGISGTTEPYKQFPYLLSGGVGGAAAIAVGVTLYISYEHARDRAALGQVLSRLGHLEERLEALAEPVPPLLDALPLEAPLLRPTGTAPTSTAPTSTAPTGAAPTGAAPTGRARAATRVRSGG